MKLNVVITQKVIPIHLQIVNYRDLIQNTPNLLNKKLSAYLNKPNFIAINNKVFI